MKPRILVFTHWYLPGYLGGGPIRTLANLVDWLGDEFEFRIVTGDRDLHAAIPYPGIVCDAWVPVGKAQVLYLSPKALGLRNVLRVLRETPHDLLYLNSFFDPQFTQVPLCLRRACRGPWPPVLLAPRGEFSAGAIKIKAWKKGPYLALARWAGLYRDAHWQASTNLEALDIENRMAPSAERLHIACNLRPRPDAGHSVAAVERVNREGGGMKICFLSRIARMKNLDFALRVLAEVKTPVAFNIFGPQEDPRYWRECEALIGELPAHVKAQYLGSVPNDRVRETIAGHDLFFVPTKGENYGHVFMEAWSAGVPVLTSDQTPWRDLTEKGIGWEFPLARKDLFVDLLNQLDSQAPGPVGVTFDHCIRFSFNRPEVDIDIEAHLQMFEKSLSNKA